MAVAFFIAVVTAAISLPSCGQGGCVTDAKKVRYLAIAEAKTDTSGSIRTYMILLDSLKVETDSQADTVFRKVHLMVQELLSRGKHMQAIELLEGIRSILNDGTKHELPSRRMLANTYVCLGAAYAETGMPGIGLDCYTRGLKVTEDSLLFSQRAMLFNNIAVLHHSSGHLDKAEKYYLKALEINKRLNAREEIFLNFYNLALLYGEKGELKKAIDTLLRGIQYSSVEHHPENFYYSQIFLGSLYARTGETGMAATFLRNSLQQLEEINFVPGIINARYAYADYFNRIGRSDSARIYAQSALDLSYRSRLHPEQDSSYKALTQSFIAAGDFPNAVRCLQSRIALKDSVQNEEKRIRLTEWEEHAAFNDKSSESVPRHNRTVLSLAAGCSVLLCSGIILLILLIRTRKKRAAGQKELHDKIDNLNRALTAESIDKFKTHEGVESVCDDLRSLLGESAFKSASHTTKARSLLGKLTSISDSTTEEFRRSFENVHPDFYRRLEEQYPELTVRDKRLCAFLVLGLSTKEIASISYREVRSVESARLRLRKKLNIDQDISLHDFLNNFL